MKVSVPPIVTVYEGEGVIIIEFAPEGPPERSVRVSFPTGILWK